MAKLRLPDLKDPIVRAKVIIWALTAAIVLVAFSVSAIGLTSRKAFCRDVCHEMDADLVAYEKSGHAHISCYGCHMPAGANPVIFMMHKVKALGELYLHIANSWERPINAGSEYAFEEAKAADCEQCHAMSQRKVSPTPGIIIDHKVHSEKGVKCTWCHNRTAHPGVPVYEDWMAMEACFRCHTQEKGEAKEAAAEGGEAAAAEATPAEATPAEGAAEEGAAAESGELAEAAHRVTEVREEQETELREKFKAPGACNACHPKDFELKPADHLEEGWLPKKHHAAYKVVSKPETQMAEAGKEDVTSVTFGDKPCTVCHAKSFCTDCHGLEMPHPETFLKEKHKEFKGETKVCEKCHGTEDFCNRCHHNNVPTLKAWLAPTGHPAEVIKNGAPQCFKCHDPRLCESCHIRGKSTTKYL
jgi:hypothetical protein